MPYGSGGHAGQSRPCSVALGRFCAVPRPSDGTGYPAERKFAACLELFDRGDRAAYQEFLEKNYPSHHQPADQAMASFVEPCGIQSAALRFLEFRAMTDDPLASR